MSNNPEMTLHDAVHARDMAAVRTLLARGADPSGCSAAGESFLATAIVNGDTGIVKDLLAAGVERDYIDTFHQLSPLQLAARHGHRGGVALLLPLADVNLIEPGRGQSALFYTVGEFAMRNGKSLWILQRLLWAGADCRLTNHNGLTVIDIARAAGQREHETMLCKDC